MAFPKIFLSRLFMPLLHIRRSIRRLGAENTGRGQPLSHRKLRKILNAVDIGVWELDTASGSLHWDRSMYRVYGMDPETFVPSYESWSKLMHSDDRARLMSEFYSAAANKEIWNFRFRIITSEGKERWIESRFCTFYEGKLCGINWDVTKQAQAEADLALQQNLNEAILNNIPVAVFMKDIKNQLRIATWNKASEEMLGVERSQIIGKNINELCGKQGSIYAASDRQVLQTGLPVDIPEEPYFSKALGQRYFHTKKVPFKVGGEPEPSYILCITEDITERKIALEEQRRHELRIADLHRRLALSVLSAGFGIWELDLKENRLIWDEQMHRIYGSSPETFHVSLESWLKSVHPDDREAAFQRLLSCGANGASESVMFRFSRHDTGELRYVEGNAYAQLDSDGKPGRLVGMNRDVTERRHIEEALKQSERVFRTVFDSAPLGIALIDPLTGRMEKVNSRYADIAGRSIEELKCISWTSMLHPEDAITEVDFIRQIEARETPLRMKKRLLKPNGAIVWIDFALTAIHQDHDYASGLRHVCMIEDISERVRTEAELQRAKTVAEESTLVKSAFLANMSHEIRTPLTVIRGYAELLFKSQLSPESALTFKGNILRSCQQLEGLLGDILDLSKVESGKLPLDFSKVGLGQLMFEIKNVLELFAADKGIGLSFRIHKNVPATIYTDPARFKQILINVVQNAIKFTDEGQVEVDIHFEPPDSQSSKRLLLFRVRDTGIGIALHHREKVFETFSQADSSITRRFGGTGLGLPLARHLARLLGGDVTLEQSELKKGTCFLITIDPGPLLEIEKQGLLGDFEPLPRPAPPSTANFQLDGLHILLVEDAPDLRALFSMVLEEHGVRISTAAHGLEGVELVQAERYDIILMDIQMPILGGYEAMQRIRQMGYRTPVIALTAHAMKGERERCLEAGFSEYLSKPIDFERLFHLISRFSQVRAHSRVMHSDGAQPLS